MTEINYEIKNLALKNSAHNLNLHYLFPNIESEKLKEYDNFIRGFIDISKGIFNNHINSSNNTNKNSLINILSAYASSSLFTNVINSNNTSLSYFDFITETNNSQENIDIVVNRLNNCILRNLKNSVLDPSSKINSFFSNLNSFCKTKLNKLNLEDLSVKINYEDKIFRYPNNSNLNPLIKTNFSFSKFRNEKFIGDQSIVKSMNNLFSLLLYYDINKKNNPLLELFDIPKVITLIGSSGTGKTMLTLKTIDYLSEQCSNLNKPFEFMQIDSNVKSEYKSLSERNLKNIFDRAYSGKSIAIILIEEIDTKIFSRRNLLSNNASELSFTGTFLEALEGTDEYKGNFLVIATSNRQINSDSALQRRLMEYSLFFEGLKTPKHHEALFKNKLNKGMNAGYVDITNWNKIGLVSNSYGFQGGDIKNIVLKLNEYLLRTINLNDKNSQYSISQIKNNISKVNTDLVLEFMSKYNKDKNLFSKDFLEVNNEHTRNN